MKDLYNDYDLIICDLFMPNKDGMELIMELRLNKNKVKIIAISGGTKNLPAEMYLNVTSETGADRILEKPFHGEKLIRVVEELIGVDNK